MKKFFNTLKRGLIVALAVVPLAIGGVLIGFQSNGNGKQSVTLSASENLENEAFNGRSSNATEGSGYIESGSVGSSLTEPVVLDTWHDMYATLGMTVFNDFKNNAAATRTKTFLEGTAEEYTVEFVVGDYRLSEWNQTNLSTRGTSVDNPWIISTVQELAFWSKYITLANTSANAKTAYVDTPYFRIDCLYEVDYKYVEIGEDSYVYGAYTLVQDGVDGDENPIMERVSTNTLDFSVARWVPPYFHYSSTSYNQVSSTDNRIFFDGNNKTFENVYVKQSRSTTNNAWASYPSIFGQLTEKSQVRNLNVVGAYVAEGATANPAAIISVNVANNTTVTNAIFSKINVSNSFVQGSTYGVSGIAANAGIISECSVSDTTISYTPSTTSVAQARGIGHAVSFIDNSVSNVSIEVTNPDVATWAIGIGSVVAASATDLYLTNGAYASAGFKTAYIFDTDRDFDEDLGTLSTDFVGGFFRNSVDGSRITVTANGGSTSNYGHASGIGYINVATPTLFKGNELSNSLVSVKTENNTIASEAYAAGMLFVSYTANDTNGARILEIKDNSVKQSTVSVVTQTSLTTASGMFIVNSETIDARIRDCYTENTDVISRYIKYNLTNSTIYTVASGINAGYATLIENCVVGSGNIDARNEKSNVYAYGIGSTLGKYTMSGPTGVSSLANPYGRVYYEGEGDTAKYVGDRPVTQINNCYNFSNISTGNSLDGILYTAGIGMAEGFDGCINYGNVMGNYVGGISVGIHNSPGNNTPTLLNKKYSSYHQVRPLIINNCANFGNLIKAANDITSFIGGIVGNYYNTLNYEREYEEVYKEDMDGKHFEVTNCINEGVPFFYIKQDDNSYSLTKEYGDVSVNKLYYGAIFGRLNTTAYAYSGNTVFDQAAFDAFLSERFIIENNFYSEDTRFDLSHWKTDANIRESGETYNKNLTTEFENATEYDYITGRPTSNYYTNELGVAYNASSIASTYKDADDVSYTVGGAANGYEKVYIQIAKNWSNTSFDAYTDVDLSSSVTVRAKMETAGWDLTSNVPQIVDVEEIEDVVEGRTFPFQILAYDRDNVTQGYVPNVSIEKLSRDQINDNAAKTFEFTIGMLQNPEVGYSVETWYSYDKDLSYKTGSPYNFTRDSGLPVTMLFAEDDLTEFDIFAADYTVENVGDYDFTIETSLHTMKDNAEITLVYTNLSTNVQYVSAVVWQAQNKTGAWEDISAVYYGASEMPVNFDGGEPGDGAVSQPFELELPIDADFINKYAKGELHNYYFSITAKVSTDELYTVGVELPNADSNTTLNVDWRTITQNDFFTTGEGGEIIPVDVSFSSIEQSVIMLTAGFDSEIYTFVKYEVWANVEKVVAEETVTVKEQVGDNGYIGSTQYFEFVENDMIAANNIYSSMMSIRITAEISHISFELDAKAYDISIQTYMFTSGNMRAQLDVPGLIETDVELLGDAMYVGAPNLSLSVSDFFEDINSQCYYEFKRWEYRDKNGNTITVDTSEMALGEITDSGLVKQNLRGTAEERSFVIVALYERKVKLIVNMYRPGMEHAQDEYANSFKIFDGAADSEEPIGSFDSQGEVIVYENTLLRIEFIPDTRLKIHQIDGINAESRNDFASNVLFLSFNTLRNVEVTLTPRPAKVLLYTNEAHEAYDKVTGLVTINGLSSDEVSLDKDHSVTIAVDYNSFGNNYRFLNLGRKYARSDSYDFLSPNHSKNFVMEINDNFFKDYVDIDGNCIIVLFIAATYEVDIAESNFKKASDSYTYTDNIDGKGGNSFALTFSDSSGVRMAEEGNDFKFVIDHGVEISYVCQDTDYSTFAGVIGINGAVDKEGSVTILSPRELAFNFELDEYTLTLAQLGSGKAEINDSYETKFTLGSTITFNIELSSAAYSINGVKIKIGNEYKSVSELSSLGVTREKSAISIKVTPAFMEAISVVTSGNDEDGIVRLVALDVDVAAGVSGAILGGVGGGVAGLIVLALVIVLLLVRSRRINEQRKKAEALAREYEQRFNIGNVIADLKKLD